MFPLVLVLLLEEDDIGPRILVCRHGHSGARCAYVRQRRFALTLVGVIKFHAEDVTGRLDLRP
jgi:hypothetical protein